MASNKVWVVKYVVGNPQMFSRVQKSNLMSRSDAIECVDNMDFRWRVWVEHCKTGERIFESSAEIEWKAENE